MHTQTTAGYGVLYPLSWWCNLMVLAHIWTCTIFTALVTSILLLNITRPKYALHSSIAELMYPGSLPA